MIWDNAYFQNVVSDFITLAILVGAGSVAYRLTRRRNMLRFFECERSRVLSIYLSNLTIRSGTALDLQGRTRGRHGPAVPGYEITLVAGAYRTFLAPVPGLADQRGFLRFLALRDLALRIEPSPLRAPDLVSVGPLLAIGSRAYNAATVAAEDRTATCPLAVLDLENGVTLADGDGRFTGPRYALLQKVYNSDRQQWIFEVAGMNEAGTIAAYTHLMNNWAFLLRRYGHGPGSQFVRVLEVGDGVARPVAHESPGAGGVATPRGRRWPGRRRR